MQAFTYRRASTLDDAFKSPGRFLSGGTNLIDHMKLDVETPKAIIDVGHLPFTKIEKTKTGLMIGASTKNADVAHHDLVKKEYAVLSQAILAGASAQLRNKASTAGNVLQRTRCVYFRDVSKPCNKRQPGSGCAAIDGYNRNLAILGTSPKCIANNPSDQNVALMALEAKVHLQSASGKREVAFNDFYLLPGDTPEKETVMTDGELITGVSIEALPKGSKSYYLKLRDRASYEFALASTAIVATVSKGRIERVRIALGGVGAKPWRLFDVEKMLEGQPASPDLFKRAAELAVRDAKPQSMNAFKVELAKRCLIAALTHVTKA